MSEEATAKPESMTDFFGEVIHSYTRAEALSDGFLFDMNQVIPINESGYKFPVACTSAVYSIIERAVKNERCMNDYKGVIWDFFHMSRMYGKGSEFLFPVIITGAGRKRNYQFKCCIGPGDNGEGVITIMLPEED